jgi:K+-transporting ATPase KdpF subunit
MDIVWMGALLALWAVVAAMVVGLNRLDAPKIESAENAQTPQRRSIVISLEVLYGFGALIAVILFAYLVFALICAEEF